uniref:Glutaredoxin domain-containing protein n=1 Tax=Capra hircus TaxID=9925 RepID=A0A8C2RMZ2_CAPHI
QQQLRLCWGNFDYGFNFYHAFINPTCPYCRRTQKLVSQLPFKQGLLEFVDITANGDTNEIQDYLQQLTGARTVPRVFISKECTDLALKQLVQKQLQLGHIKPSTSS